MPLSVGDKLGPYEILAPIGTGGMGEVYRAKDARLVRIVRRDTPPRYPPSGDRVRSPPTLSSLI